MSDCTSKLIDVFENLFLKAQDFYDTMFEWIDYS